MECGSVCVSGVEMFSHLTYCSAFPSWSFCQGPVEKMKYLIKIGKDKAVF